MLRRKGLKQVKRIQTENNKSENSTKVEIKGSFVTSDPIISRRIGIHSHSWVVQFIQRPQIVRKWKFCFVLMNSKMHSESFDYLQETIYSVLTKKVDLNDIVYANVLNNWSIMLRKGRYAQRFPLIVRCWYRQETNPYKGLSYILITGEKYSFNW